MEMSNDETGYSTQDFNRRLQSLKRQGCNLLVTGEVREEVSQRMTRKLLGATDVPRTRILALTDQDEVDVPDLLPGGVGPMDRDVYVVDYDCGTRDAVTAASAGSGGPEWRRGDLDDLQTTVCNAIAVAKDGESGFDPAQLRLSLFTLSYLVGQYERDEVERFVGAVGDHVRGVSGMAHYHLPLSDDSETVREFAPLFDARIELREKEGRPEQRWHLSGFDEPTSWVGV